MTSPGIPTVHALALVPFHVNKIELTETARWCVLCDAWSIAKGVSCVFVAYEYQGSRYMHSACLPCWELLPTVDRWFPERGRIDNTDYRVWAVANLYDEYWGRSAIRYLERTKLNFRWAGHE